jgi:hypothetical protein
MTRVEGPEWNNSKNDRRYNTIKHGAFAKELIILDENKDDFDELHQSCVKELRPSGRMEGEVVLAIAKYSGASAASSACLSMKQIGCRSILTTRS